MSPARARKAGDVAIKNSIQHPTRIFSGDYSKDMWDAINNARTKADLRHALYFVCCRLQELESKLAAPGAGAKGG